MICIVDESKPPRGSGIIIKMLMFRPPFFIGRQMRSPFPQPKRRPSTIYPFPSKTKNEASLMSMLAVISSFDILHYVKHSLELRIYFIRWPNISLADLTNSSSRASHSSLSASRKYLPSGRLNFIGSRPSVETSSLALCDP